MPKEKSDLSRAFSEDGKLKTHVGGQALLEGIMMRGKFNWAVAVREPTGAIYTEEHDLASGRPHNSWLRWPIVRGCTAFVESLALGYKALEIAALHAFDDEPSEDVPVESDKPAAAGSTVPVAVESGDSTAATTDDSREGSSKRDPEFGHREMVVSMVLGLVLGIVLFVVVPAVTTNFIVGEYDHATLAWNLVDGLLRVAVFVFYLWLIGRMKDIQRMFGYHGAEHKTIHCFEHGLPLTPENARRFPRLHVRCGTAFLIMVMIIAILVYTITPINGLIAAWGVSDGASKLALVIAVRILLMPIIAGLSYEITVKWAGSHPENPLVKVVLWPGMQMQYLTTKEPDDRQIECAIAAMQIVLTRENVEAMRVQQGEDATKDMVSMPVNSERLQER